MRKIQPNSFFFVAACIFCYFVQSQNYPKDFIWPLKIPIQLSANYAELRKNHFHAGIDVRTQQIEGHPLYAAADGYVSRINVSPVGYGKAIYITHPNGFTTVYAHCLSFVGKIAERTRLEQYKRKQFRVDFTLKPNEIVVKQGELIALAGNSGSSNGPHLHFEVRDTKTEEPINPFFFGFDVPDTSKPMVHEIWIFPIHGKVRGSNKKYQLKEKDFKDEIPVAGKISFGVKAFDKHDGVDNINGVYRIKSFVNDKLYYDFVTDKFAFDETRYIHSVTDYEQHIEKNSWVYRTYKQPGNSLQMCKYAFNSGILEVKEDSLYQVRIEVSDYKGNTQIRTFTLKGRSFDSEEQPVEGEIIAQYNSPLIVEREGFYAEFKTGSFYENFPLEYKFKRDVHHFHYSNVPIHHRYTLRIQPPNELKYNLNKLVVKRVQNKGKPTKEYLVPKIVDGWLEVSPKDFGDFSVEVDITPPSINPVNVAHKKVFKGSGNVLKFKISDDISGINTYDVFLNGQWVLADYDAKYDLLSMYLDEEKIDYGTYLVEVYVTDFVNNQKLYLAEITLEP